MEITIVLFKHGTVDEYNRLKGEFWDERFHPIIRAFLLDLGLFTVRMFDKQLVVTSIFRSEEENGAIGGVPGSSHCDWRAADVRSSVFTDTERLAILEYAKRYGSLIHFIYEVGGTGAHFHANVNKSALIRLGL